MPDQQLKTAWNRYRSNLLRHMAAISVYSERNTMARLTERNYPRLAMSFAQPLTLLAQKPQRLTDLAAAQGMSKQLCLQSLKPIEAAGYICRQPDPDDKRAKQVCLTEQGQHMIRDALTELQSIEEEFSGLLGKKKLKTMTDAALLMNHRLRTPGTGNSEQAPQLLPMLSSLIGSLTRQLHKQLMQATIQRGHPGLQMSYGQVLSCIDLAGTAIGTIAAQNNVSSPAISRIVRELEKQQYIERRQDADDRRTVKLFFTRRGLQLIVDSVDAMTEIEDSMQDMIGEQAFGQFSKGAEQLYKKLDLEHDLVKAWQPGLVEEQITPSHNTGLSTDDILAYVESQLLESEADVKDIEQRLRERLGNTQLSRFRELLQKLR